MPGILISVMIRSGLSEFNARRASDPFGKVSIIKSSSNALLQIVLMLSSSSTTQSLYFFIVAPWKNN